MASDQWPVLYPIPKPTATVLPLVTALSAADRPVASVIPVPVQAEWYQDFEDFMCTCHVNCQFVFFVSCLESF